MGAVEAVSSQLERWYEGKVEEARCQAAQRTEALVERVGQLEEELRLLRLSRTGARDQDQDQTPAAITTVIRTKSADAAKST